MHETRAKQSRIALLAAIIMLTLHAMPCGHAWMFTIWVHTMVDSNLPAVESKTNDFTHLFQYFKNHRCSICNRELTSKHSISDCEYKLLKCVLSVYKRNINAIWYWNGHLQYNYKTFKMYLFTIHSSVKVFLHFLFVLKTGLESLFSLIPSSFSHTKKNDQNVSCTAC